MRFYDDKDEGAVNIPADAEARPFGNAVWNVLSKEWVLPTTSPWGTPPSGRRRIEIVLLIKST